MPWPGRYARAPATRLSSSECPGIDDHGIGAQKGLDSDGGPRESAKTSGPAWSGSPPRAPSPLRRRQPLGACRSRSPCRRTATDCDPAPNARCSNGFRVGREGHHGAPHGRSSCRARARCLDADGVEHEIDESPSTRPSSPRLPLTPSVAPSASAAALRSSRGSSTPPTRRPRRHGLQRMKPRSGAGHDRPPRRPALDAERRRSRHAVARGSASARSGLGPVQAAGAAPDRR